MAMRTRWSNARGIAQFRKSRATLDAPGRRHWVTTSSVLPQWPPGQQKTNNNQQMTLKRWPNWWPWRCAGTLPRTSPNGGGLGLFKMPLNATIGWVLRPIWQMWHSNASILHFIRGQCCWGWRNINMTRWKQHGGVIYQTDQKDFADVIEHSQGRDNLVKSN